MRQLTSADDTAKFAPGDIPGCWHPSVAPEASGVVDVINARADLPEVRRAIPAQNERAATAGRREGRRSRLPSSTASTTPATAPNRWPSQEIPA